MPLKSHFCRGPLHCLIKLIVYRLYIAFIYHKLDLLFLQVFMSSMQPVKQKQFTWPGPLNPLVVVKMNKEVI